MNITEEELNKMTLPKIVEGIIKVRQGNITVEAGYDGVFGTVKVWPEQEKMSEAEAVGQKSLF